MLLNKKGDLGGSTDWINVIIIILLASLVTLAYFGIGISVFGYILGVLFVVAGVFGIYDGLKIDGFIWKTLTSLAFFIVGLIGANLVFALPYVGKYITPAQEFYSTPGVISFIVIAIIIVILILDIFMSDEYF